MRNKVFLSLGSNIGDREKYLMTALGLISSLDRTDLHLISNIYETDPVGYEKQERFLNIAALVYSVQSPQILLEELLQIEKDLKREREIRWGPRTIDIDILLYGNMTINLPELTIPHPRMFERAFVLIPLKDIFKDEDIIGINIDELLKKCSDRDGVKLFKKNIGLLEMYDAKAPVENFCASSYFSYRI